MQELFQGETLRFPLVFQKQAPARAGAIAPCPVMIPKQATSLGPEKTSFFQALQIQTKITKGCIEMLVGTGLLSLLLVLASQLRTMSVAIERLLVLSQEQSVLPSSSGK